METHRHRCDHCGDQHLCTLPTAPKETPAPRPPRLSTTTREWTEERLTPGEWTRASLLYADYESWARSRGYMPVSLRMFGTTLPYLGFKKKRSDGIQYAAVLRP